MVARPKMPLEVLRQTDEYRKLPFKMGTFVWSYLAAYEADGMLDPLFAAKNSYDCANDNSARAFGYELLRKPKVAAVLKIYFDFGKSQREKDLEQIEDALAKAEPHTVAYQRLLSIRTSIRLAPVYDGEVLNAPEPEAPVVAKKTVQDPRIPVGAVPLRDKDGVIRGYQTAEGKKFRLAEVEAEQ